MPDGLTGFESVAFLLAVVGQDVRRRTAKHLAGIGLKPAHVAILYAIATESGRSQQEVSAQLAVAPSRLVGYVDHLEQSGYLERGPRPGDRRRHALQITPAGKTLMGDLAALASAYEERFGLDAEQIAVLHRHLAIAARHQGLLPPDPP